MKSPKVSILIPVFNRVTLLPDCIESIRRQTFSAIEIVIYDDGSTDGTGDLIHKLALEDDRIRYTINSANMGVSNARNFLLDLAVCDIACWQDSDDMSNIYRIEKQFSVMEKTDKICVSTCHTKLFSHNKNECFRYPGVFDGDRGNSLGSIMFRTKEAVRFIEDVNMGGEDVDWKRDMKKSGIEFFNLPERLYYVRLTNRDRIGCLKLKHKKERMKSNERRRKRQARNLNMYDI